MKKVGSYEAKTHLSALLDEISKGERVIITKHGAPVALMSPVGSERKNPVNETIAEIRSLRKKHSLDGLSLRELIDEGRK